MQKITRDVGVIVHSRRVVSAASGRYLRTIRSRPDLIPSHGVFHSRK